MKGKNDNKPVTELVANPSILSESHLTIMHVLRAATSKMQNND